MISSSPSLVADRPLAPSSVFDEDVPQTLAATGGPARLEADLSRPWWQLRFSQAVEALYLRDTRAGQARRMAIGNLFGAASFFWVTANNAAVWTGMNPWVHLLRWLALGTLVAGAVVAGSKRVSARSAEAATALGAMMVATFGAVTTASFFDNLSVIGMGGRFLIFMSSAILIRQQFRWTLGVSLYVLVTFALAAIWRPAALDVVTRGQTTLLGYAFVLTMITNFALEFRERRTYLLRALQRHRDGAMATSAETLKHMALHDALTGLANRRQFNSELVRTWERAASRAEALAVVIADIDWFKRYNDRYGHPQGDRCLRQVSAALQAVAKKHGGLAGRLGGEEFGLILPGLDPARAQAAAEDACTAVQALKLDHADSSWGHVTVSVGVASTQALAGGDPTALLRAADERLYGAKASGRNRSASVALPAQPGPAAAAPLPIGGPTCENLPEAETIDRLNRLLDAPAWRLRFPVDLEAAYGERDARPRRVWLFTRGLGGIACTLLCLWLSQPLFADVAGRAWTGALWLAAGVMPLIMATLLPLRWHWREALFTAAPMVLGIGLAWLAAASQLITVYSYSLGFFMIPMFCLVIAAQPLRMCLVPSIGFWAVVAAIFCPARHSDAWTVWARACGLSLNALLYSLWGGYLLDRSLRHEYLLMCLGGAQRTLLQRHATEMQRLAETDALTGMPNRRHFETESSLLQKRCRSQGQPLALLLIDIDHFKRYNDGYGHAAGDACLVRVAGALLQWAAEGASRGVVAARIGGEEFGVLLPDHHLGAARTVADGLCRRVRELAVEHRYAPTPGGVTVSIGAASLVLTGADDGHRLMQTADDALYDAKRLGRDQASG